MKKQSGPFKLKYKKSAFPFMENFHVKKHGKLKIVRGKSTKDEIDEKGNPVYQGIDQSKLVPLLVGAIQELKAEIEILKNK